MKAYELYRELHRGLLEAEIQKKLPTPTKEEGIELYHHVPDLYAGIQTEVAILIQAALKIQELGYEIVRKQTPNQKER